MNQISQFGKVLLFWGIAIAVLGSLLMLTAKIKWLGQLPGDIFIKKKNFIFYFPLATSILISLLFSFLLWIFAKK